MHTIYHRRAAARSTPAGTLRTNPAYRSGGTHPNTLHSSQVSSHAHDRTEPLRHGCHTPDSRGNQAAGSSGSARQHRRTAHNRDNAYAAPPPGEQRHAQRKKNHRRKTHRKRTLCILHKTSEEQMSVRISTLQQEKQEQTLFSTTGEHITVSEPSPSHHEAKA